MTLVPAESTTLAARDAIVAGQIVVEPQQLKSGDIFTHYTGLLQAATIPFMQYES
jgi:hypothetical protein